MVGELLVVWCDKKLYGRVTCWLYGVVKESYAGQAPALVRLTKYEKKLHPAVRNNPFYHIYVTSQTPYPPFKCATKVTASETGEIHTDNDLSDVTLV